MKIAGIFPVFDIGILYYLLQLGRSKWNGNVGTTGIVLRTEVPLGSVGQPSFSIQLNSGIEF